MDYSFNRKQLLKCRTFSRRVQLGTIMKKTCIATLAAIVALTSRAEKAPPAKAIAIANSSGLVQETYPVHPQMDGEGAISF